VDFKFIIFLDGRFYWIQTGEEFAYHNFAASYPNGGLPESCAYIWGDGLWYLNLDLYILILIY
jgi:hypothetical protein